MKRLIGLVVLCVFVGLAASVWAVPIKGPASKVDAMLRLKAKMLPYDKEAGAVLPSPNEIQAQRDIRLTSPVGKILPTKFGVPTTTSQNREYYSVFLKFEGTLQRDVLENMGVSIHTVVDGYCTADVPADQLEAVASLDWILNIEGSRYPELFLDAAVQDTHVDQVWNNLSYRGNDVLVGVVDSGIDWAHGDFKNANNLSRIRYIWDQSSDTAPKPNGFDYGTEWTKAQIDAGACTEVDQPPVCHGTHVAGIAAGDGSGTGNGQAAGRFVGVANLSDILFVKYRNMDGAVDGVNYMFQKAQQIGKPMSINMSLGTVDGPHDGSTALEQTLSQVLGQDVPGRALVIAAANSGGQTIHARSTSLPATTGQGLLGYPHIVFAAYYGNGVPWIPVEIYYPHGSTLKVSVVYPADQNYSNVVQTPWVAPGEEHKIASITEGPLAGAEIAITHENPNTLGNTNLNHVFIEFYNNNNANIPLDAYKYYILLDGPGVAIDAWHVFRDKGGLVSRSAIQTPPATMLDADDNYTLGRPATMTSAISIASHVTKVQWTDFNNQTQTQQGATVGQISGFSSKGPRRDEVDKPDLSAPGEAIISTLAANYVDVDKSQVERDGVHQKMQGTSQASPHVCGVAALMLEKNPTLTQSQIKNILRSTSVEAGDAGWDTTWGAGKLNALAALNAVQTSATATPTPAVPTSTPTQIAPTATPTPAGNQGDVNLDSVVDTRDGIRLLRHIEGVELLTGQGLVNADANGDQQVNNTDVDWILDRTVGK